jgi:hypothetical protein
MGRLSFAAILALSACGASSWNSYDGDLANLSNGDASYLNYPTSRTMDIASRVDAVAAGMAITGDTATVHMDGMTCGVHMTTGTLTFDEDLDDGEVQDGDQSPSLELTSVHTSGPLIQLIDLDNPKNPTSFLVRGLREVRLTGPSGFVVLRQAPSGSCEVRWYDHMQFQSKTMFDADCDANVDMALDRSTGLVHAAVDGQVFRVDVEGSELLTTAGDQVEWDATYDRLYVGTTGEGRVRVVADGAVIDSIELNGQLHAMHDAGAPGGLVVAANQGITSTIQRFNADGGLIDQLDFHRSVVDITVDQTGTAMGVARSTDHAYYFLK